MATSTTAFVGRTAKGPVDEPTLITSFSEFDRVFGGLWAKSELGHQVADFFEQGGRRAVIVRVHRPAPGDVARLVFGGRRDGLILEASSPGVWGSRLVATIDPGRNGSFDVTVIDNGTGRTEVFQRVSLRAGSRQRLDRALGKSDLVRAATPLPAVLPVSTSITATATGGNDGGRIGAMDLTAAAGIRQRRQGLYALEKTEPVGLIVIPPYSSAGVAARVTADAADLARERRAMLLMDPPRRWKSVADAAQGASAPSLPAEANVAVYFPRLLRSDPLRGGQVGEHGPAGAVAGVLARVDLNRGVWKSPAGAEAGLVGLAGLSLELTEHDIERLNPLGINCLRTIPPGRPVIWGARTRSTDLEWKYVAVRRTTLFLERSIEEGLRWAVFEPNEETTWSSIRVEVQAFLHTLFNQGAFQGRTPSEAFFVKCDATTTSQDDIDNGRTIVLVGFAPTRPAEFVLLRIALQRED